MVQQWLYKGSKQIEPFEASNYPRIKKYSLKPPTYTYSNDKNNNNNKTTLNKNIWNISLSNLSSADSNKCLNKLNKNLMVLRIINNTRQITFDCFYIRSLNEFD